MKIISLTAENVKKLRAVTITPEGNVVQITGANGSGKSSVLDAIYMALAGKDAVPSTPIRKGEESARIRLDLGDMIVTRKFTAAGTTLTVTTADGAKYASPQAMLDGLLGTLTFDPLAFSRMKPREQRDQLAAMAGLTETLYALSVEDEADYDERTGVNREAKAAQARLDAMPEVAACEPVDVTELLEQIATAGAHNASVQGEQARRSRVAVDIEGWKGRAASLRREADEAEARALSMEQDLAALPPLPSLVDVADLRAEYDRGMAQSVQAEAYARREAVRAEVDTLRAKSEALSAALKAREAERAAVIAAASFPVDGLAVTEDGVTLHGLPLEQASSAEQLRVSVAIAMAANPKLRVLRIKDGSLLDSTSLALLAQMADANDYQCWVERVDTSGAVGIVMEDGEARVAEAAA